MSSERSVPVADAPASVGAVHFRRWRSDGPVTNALRPTGIPSFVWLAAGALAVIYFALFVLRFAGNIAALDWVSDYSSGFLLAETLVKTGTGGNTVISTTGAYAPLWFGLLTAHLPLHRQLWEIMPAVLFVGTALTIGWSVAQVAGRRAALLAVLIVLVASPWALRFFIAAVAHNTVYPCTALLGAYLIWLTRGHERRRSTAIAVVLLSALVLGVCIASDALLIVTGLIPFAITALAAGMRRTRESKLVALSALATALGAIPIAILTAAIMRSAGYVTVPPAAELAPLSIIAENAKLLFEGFRELSNGYLGATHPGRLHSEIGFACDAVMVAALLTVLVVGGRRTVRFISSGRRRHHAESPAQLALGLHTFYWFASALLVCAAFVFSKPVEAGRHESYYATVIFSIAAIVPLLIARGRIAYWLVPSAACVFFLGSIVGLKRNYLQVNQPAISHYAAEITDLAEANHVRTGYAGYWDAAGLTWNSHERVIVRPLVQCVNPNPAGAAICPFVLMRTPSWYVPQRRHTFLLVDPNNLFVTALPPGLGPPIANYTIGPIQMYVYPYDIASRLGPGSN